MSRRDAGDVHVVRDGVILKSGATTKHASNNRIIVVTGEDRGGTSMVASVCHHLGIPMGRGGPRYENKFLQKAVLAERWDVVEVLVGIISEYYLLWGWKLPALMPQMSHLESLRFDVRIVVIFKDPISIGCRRIKIRPNKEPMGMILSSLPRYIKALEFIRKTTLPCLLVSYEKAQIDMAGFSSALADYCGVAQPLVSKIVKNIQQDAIKYNNNPSLRKDVTNIEAEREDKFGGMSMQLYSKLRSASIEMGLEL